MKQERPPAARRVRWTPRLLLFLLLLLPLFPGCKGWDTPFGNGADADDPLRPGGAIPTQPNTPPPQPQPPSPTAARDPDSTAAVECVGADHGIDDSHDPGGTGDGRRSSG